MRHFHHHRITTVLRKAGTLARITQTGMHFDRPVQQSSKKHVIAELYRDKPLHKELSPDHTTFVARYHDGLDRMSLPVSG